MTVVKTSCDKTPQEALQPPVGRRFNFKLNTLDIILLIIIGCFIGWLAYRSSIGIHYHWHWRQAIKLVFTCSHNGGIPYFIQGIISTIRVSLWGMLFAATFGLLLALANLSSFRIMKLFASSYIQLLRNIPPLVFVFIFYFFISNQLVPLLGLNHIFRHYNGEENILQIILFGRSNLWENLFSGVLCVGLIAAAYIAEIIRAGINTISKGQWEAADSLGLSTYSRFRFVIFPQAFAAIVPTLAGQFISIVKDSSIISLISIQELTFTGSEIANSSGFIFEIWLIVGLVYFILCFSLSLLFRKLEKHSSRHLQHS
ncbi:ABC transporter permease subunit [Photobacterium iliopiscarium]|jgi:polar amino acid transport system permease protein|uniref:Amino acid ABC transporter permease n=1 Tax=Photobacterium iliopiscarium TaxID=56192 RepID=A0A2T3MLC5_9GAMM|nr:ABC transporter permease subunit [Photobacterium iliopiscarium]PST96075.1 amino acid ABC transporter permease [Photobacterium iliopiscarium]PST99605.1 amino acid ABC transporter permease [Photobacterium iliopiscarium]PSV82929.1 amino acid ABC transporter permease [Photobacterium iliopiscarium]PSV97103.1 amino acid ABC transporter permease [Photobacterium iliopiscarium]PSW96616.1 amino acid ABC transporter permease [Photobacterium iliopiscarium]